MPLKTVRRHTWHAGMGWLLHGAPPPPLLPRSLPAQLRIITIKLLCGAMAIQQVRPLPNLTCWLIQSCLHRRLAPGNLPARHAGVTQGGHS